MFIRVLTLGILLLPRAALCEEPDVRKHLKEIRYLSKADNSKQPAMLYVPKVKKPVPLLVALHSWSADYKQRSHDPCAKWCIEKNWAFIHPNFRGPNKKPDATGSELVVQDILSAVDYVKGITNVDENRIYLIGASGGGYTSLLMAGRAPKVWAGVSAWVPISDLRAWYFECKKSNRKYWKEIVQSCGGAPGESEKVDQEYKVRSPLTHLSHARGIALDINAGIHDGHTGSVPVSHSLLAFNKVADERNRIADRDIQWMVEKEKIPASLQMKIDDPTYGKKKPLFRRTSGKARVTIFEGGHELIAEAGLQWLAKQRRK